MKLKNNTTSLKKRKKGKKEKKGEKEKFEE
jgi:hypothetical protein